VVIIALDALATDSIFAHCGGQTDRQRRKDGRREELRGLVHD